MNVVMTLLVRDEEDILEANIDHHFAQGVDFVIATDNGSVDDTAGILERYEREGRLRLIHEPTGLVASSQEERSQLQNREKALNRLKAMIAAKVEEERAAELDRIAGRQAQVGWGSQIRSYVLQPYQMVKDLRTEVETSQVDAVLDGDIDELMEGYLRWRRREQDQAN